MTRYRQSRYCIKRISLNVRAAEEVYHIKYVLHTKSIKKAVPDTSQKLILHSQNWGKGELRPKSEKSPDLLKNPSYKMFFYLADDGRRKY